MKYNFTVKEITKDEALEMIQKYHYSNTLPKLNKHFLGFLLGGDLVGVVTLGWGTRPKHTIQRIFPSLDTKDYFEIGRMCMTEEMPRNSESQMLKALTKYIKTNFPNIKVLFTWADGMVGKVGYNMSVEEMIILLSTSFIMTENTEKFINSLSSLRVVEEVEFNDDGVGQTVTAKKGASMNAKFQVQPIVKLKPIRTYAEIDQVESKFLFRVNKDGSVCLREADGGQWKYETQKRIVDYLEDNLKELIDNNEVVVIG